MATEKENANGAEQSRKEMNHKSFALKYSFC